MSVTRKFTIRDELYQAHIGVAAGMGFKKAHHWYCSWIDEPYQELYVSPSVAGACIRRAHRKNCCIWFPERNPSLSTVAHEVWHASFHILMKSGVEFGYDAEEAWAHHFDWLFCEVLRGLWPKRTTLSIKP